MSPDAWIARAPGSAPPSAGSRTFSLWSARIWLCTVDLEHIERTRDGRTYHRVLRCTQVYRLEDDVWRVVVRHADELPERDTLQR